MGALVLFVKFGLLTPKKKMLKSPESGHDPMAHGRSGLNPLIRREPNDP